MKTIFFLIPQKTRVKLIEYQRDNYGEKLDPPAEFQEPIEDLEEIDKLMRQARIRD